MTKHYDFHFDRKSVTANGAVLIEGFSNKNVSDRIRERMEPKGGRFDNYKKNPIILFNHGKDEAYGIMPVGKALVIEAREEGVYTKARISNSKTEKITVVRDLVEEEILKTFSLGYETINESKDADGTTVLTDWELLEQSIVPVPMNQDSVFTLAKRYKRIGNTFGVKYLEVAALMAKGAIVAGSLRKRINDLIDNGTISDYHKALASVAEISGSKLMDIKEVMAGDRPVTPRMIHAFAVVLGVKEKELKTIMEAEMAKRSKKNCDENPPPQEDQKKLDQGVKSGSLVLHTISVPKSMYDEAESAKGYVESHGYKADQMTEDDESYHFQQAESEDLDMEKAITIEIGDGVVGKAAPRKAMTSEDPKADKKPEAEADPKAELEPKKEPPEDAEKKEAVKPADLLRQALETGDNHDRMRQLVEQALTLMGDGKSDGKSLPPTPSGADAVAQDENPYLIATRQTNVLLGTLIQEVQKLSQKLEGQVIESQESEEMLENDDEEQAKSLASLKEYQQTIDMRLKRLGV